MVIRKRLGASICLLPSILILLIGKISGNQFLTDLSFCIGLLGIVFSEKIYEFVFLDSNSTSSLYAGNLALHFGYSPKDQSGRIWNPADYKISEVYKLYPKNRKEKPCPGSAGFIFYTKKKGRYSNKMEFYDYRAGGESFMYYEFYFHPYDKNGDKTVCKEKLIKDITTDMTFVSLEKI